MSANTKRMEINDWNATYPFCKGNILQIYSSVLWVAG